MPSTSPSRQPASVPVADSTDPADLPAYACERGIDPERLEAARIRLELLYGEVAASWPGFIARPGQYQMMQAALLTFLSAKTPDDEARTGRNLAQLEAGTGTGKTVAYCLAAIVASEVLNKTIIVSTATVALQEQLFYKDLPRLAEIIPDLSYDILKGRGRYICESRLEGALNDEAQDSLLSAEFQEAFGDARRASKGDISRDSAEAKLWFKNSAKKLRSGAWDGDIDSLAQPPDPQDWRQVQANAHACNAGKCEFFRDCAFFKARRQAATATLQVANHSLILATLQTDSSLIDPGNTLFVFDEAHHLPVIAAEQFSYRARLGASIKLLAGLRTVALRHGKALPASTRPDPVAFAQLITGCTDKLALLENWWLENSLVSADRDVYRFAQGQIPDTLTPECQELASLLRAVITVVSRIAEALSDNDESRSPQERDEQGRAGVELGVYLSRLDTLEKLFTAWATHDKVPWAKWLEWADDAGGTPDAWLCASPMTAAQVLSKNLWKSVSAAVCTSATLTACGSFDFFDRLSGMNRYPARRALVVASPFDYATQGELRIAPMQHSPKSAGFSDELCTKLPVLLRQHEHGQLVLFTSRRQMQACHAALPSDLAAQVQVQGVRSRTELLKEHSRRIIAGERSIIFGLQSFGEGIDLPGQLCEHVVIDKLPFTPPNSPVEEALAEWLSAQGRDPFTELSVPRAGMKLAQWAGRGVRTVTDRAIITICDTRLVNMRYGAAILAGLPPFPVVRSSL